MLKRLESFRHLIKEDKRRRKVFLRRVFLCLLGLILAGTAVFSGIKLIKTVNASKHPSEPEDFAGTVVLDAARGGNTDPGSSYKGFWEKDLTLDIVFRIRDYLAGENFNVILTRETDEYISPDERADTANCRPDLIISICLGYSEGKISGVRAYVGNDGEEASTAAEAILESTAQSCGAENLGVSVTNSYLFLNKTKSAALVLTAGYLSDPDNAAYLTAVDGRQKLAEAIGRAISEQLKSK